MRTVRDTNQSKRDLLLKRRNNRKRAVKPFFQSSFSVLMPLAMLGIAANTFVPHHFKPGAMVNDYALPIVITALLAIYMMGSWILEKCNRMLFTSSSVKNLLICHGLMLLAGYLLLKPLVTYSIPSLINMQTGIIQTVRDSAQKQKVSTKYCHYELNPESLKSVHFQNCIEWQTYSALPEGELAIEMDIRSSAWGMTLQRIRRVNNKPYPAH
ncbi:hypothetical protein WH50_04170 [Pokkaliibacter plantistimulans]|uniref:Uncharacterized protein n=1 Tax=Pokkaliibacter plantistimulans TaxID=1635171 RepID=A0ABX5M0P2_9GAMM|nr:hypothetical protein [Pokkaliibacter plantistimulans]PXF32487.1 hypothetical protein WH50_04170 [Pokkaliibacter plantistimulans]